MIYLTDHPERAEAVLPTAASWRRCDATALDRTDRTVWSLLGSGATAWRCQADDETVKYRAITDEPRRIVVIDEAAGSQFAAVQDALKGGTELPDGLTCLALAGTGFRGQRDRSWTALRGNLHATVHYRVQASADRLGAGLTMLPAVAAAQAIERVSSGRLRPTIKWVNDVLIDGRKVGGVLTGTQVQGAQVTAVVFGIGLNVAGSPEVVVTGSDRPAGALADFEPSWSGDLSGVFAAVLSALDEGMARLTREGPARLYDAYRARAAFIGRRVRVWPVETGGGGGRRGEPVAAGRVRELRSDLSLVIEGASEPVSSGRMELMEPA